MGIDLGFTKDNLWFRYRTGALIINDNKMLFCRNKKDGYYYFIGGGVQHGETSNECIEREIFEETSLHCRVEQLAVLIENFFDDIGKICHTIELYYKVYVDNFELMTKDTDTHEELVWVSIDKIKDMDIRPKNVADRIPEILDSKSIIHIINDEHKQKLNK